MKLKEDDGWVDNLGGKYIERLKDLRFLAAPFWSAATIVMIVAGIGFTVFEPSFNAKRNYEIKVLATDFNFIWQFEHRNELRARAQRK